MEFAIKKELVRLLVVDDTQAYFEQICDYAQICEHDVSFQFKYTSSGEKALNLIGSWEPSVVLLDVHITGADSFDILRQCKGSPLPIIVTSHSCSQEIEKSVLENGACSYISKSDNPDDIEALIYLIARISSMVHLENLRLQ